MLLWTIQLTLAFALNYINQDGSLVNESLSVPVPAQNKTRPKRPAAPVVAVELCDYNGFYLDFLKEFNKVQRGEDSIFKCCMNLKLMAAAKYQSDFQALIGEPTHAGPRLVKMGSVEERVDATGFQRKSGIVGVEEIIFHWPRLQLDIFGKQRRKEIRAAIYQIMEDPKAKEIFKNPDYRFFGASFTQNPNGEAFMTIVLADSMDEVCNNCVRLTGEEFPSLKPKPAVVVP